MPPFTYLFVLFAPFSYISTYVSSFIGPPTNSTFSLPFPHSYHLFSSSTFYYLSFLYSSSSRSNPHSSLFCFSLSWPFLLISTHLLTFVWPSPLFLLDRKGPPPVGLVPCSAQVQCLHTADLHRHASCPESQAFWALPIVRKFK
jgi:hypothetical protein